MSKRDVGFIVFAFLFWRLVLFVFLILGTEFLPLQEKYLGGGIDNYVRAPWLWSWLNFDGLHYYSIAQNGYSPGKYFFFPVFPLVARWLAVIFGSIPISGLLVSNLSFLLALFGLWKLLRLDYKRKISCLVIILLLLFPASFYFASFYTESLFLALVVWAFYLARKRKWLLVAIIGAIASATRVTGTFLLPAFLFEALLLVKQKSKRTWKRVGLLFLIPFGLFFFMLYLKGQAGDFLAFNTGATQIFGEYRSATPVFLPRVFYRYFIKILPSLNWDYFPVVFSTLFEVGVGILLLILIFLGIGKLRLSYWFWLTAGYLVPTAYQNFVSLPRFALILFPAFILLAQWLSKRKVLQILIAVLLLTGLGVATAMFLRGYWVA